MKKKLILLAILTGVLIIVGFGAWFFSRPQAATTCQDVMIYQDTNYSTSAPNACFAPGQYTLAGLRSKGIADDSVSSIKMPSGFKVTVYKNDNFSGESISFTGSVPNLQDVRMNVFHTWNDKISSLKIVYTICPSPLSETRTGSCPSGQTGLITEIRTKFSAPGCTWGNWEEISNTCKTPPPPPPPPRPTPTVNLKANGSDGPITVDYNSTVKLSWTTSNADSCIASGGWSSGKDTSGEQTSSKLTSKTTFKLTCSGNGSASDSVTVEVKPKPAPTPEPNPEPTPEPNPEPTPEPEPTPVPTDDQANDQPSTDENQTPTDTSISEAPTDTTDETNTTDTTDTASTNDDTISGQTTETKKVTTQESTTDKKTNLWLYLVVGIITVGGGIYFFFKFKGEQVTGEDLLREGGEIAPDTKDVPPTEETPAEEAPTDSPPPPPVSTSSSSSPLPPNVPSTTIPTEKTDDMDID